MTSSDRQLSFTTTMVSAFEGLPVYDIIAADHDGNAHANTIDHTMTTSTAAMTVSLMLAMFAMLVLSPSISANYTKASNPSSGGERQHLWF